MSETLMDKAIRSFNVAMMIRKGMGEDEAYLNYIGYNLQQAVELCLKYQLENTGLTYPKTHDIDQLIRIAKDNGADICLTEYIEDHSEMFSLWESRTRYVLNYSLEKGKVEKALSEVSVFLKDVLEYEKIQDLSHDDDFER